MTVEQDIFLTCLADFYRGKETLRPKGTFDPEGLLELAREHSLAGVVYDRCRSWLNYDTQRNGFTRALVEGAFFSVNRQEILAEIAELFRREGVPFICMKGSVFRDDWPVPALRLMGDMDFIIRTEDREKTDRIMLEELGCSKMVDNHAVWTYTCGPLQFEIHDHMFYEYLANQVDYRGYFDNVWSHVRHGTVFGVTSDNLYVPDPDFHLLYLMTHTAKHIINNGTGFRAFLDMVFFTRGSKEELDWAHLEEELDRLQLLEFTKTCFSLCERWFGVEMPVRLDRLDEAFYRTITEKICRDGVFGLKNPQNEAAHSAKEIERSRQPYAVAAVIVTLRKIFPAYRDMQLIPWYAWVDGRPYLMPFAWIYRWYYCLSHKKKESLQSLAEPFDKKKTVDDRRKQIRAWGL